MNGLRRLLHRHRWTTIASAHADLALIPAEVTLLLQHCELCGEHRTEQIDGAWPLALFKPPTSHKGA